MSKLSDSQLVVPSAACQRPDRSVLPLPAKLKGGAAGKVINSLLAKGLIKEVRAKRDEPVWRTDDDRGRIALRATRATFEALGIDPNEAGSEDESERASDEQNAETADRSARRPKGKKRKGRYARTCAGVRCAARITGTESSPSFCAASRRPWPAMTLPASSTRTGLSHPNSTIEAAIFATWSSSCVRALRACGINRAGGTCSTASGSRGGMRGRSVR